MAKNSRTTTTRKPAAKKPVKNQKQTAARTAKTPVKSKATPKKTVTVNKTSRAVNLGKLKTISWRLNRDNRTAKKVTAESLYNWNKWLSLLHFVQGLAILILSVTKLIPINSNYITTDPLAGNDGQVFVSASKQLFDINLPYVLAAIFFVSALAHLLVATYYRKRYERDLALRVNRARWVTFAVTAGLSVITIALLAGVNEITALLALFTLAAVAKLTALVTELHAKVKPGVEWLSFAVMCLAGVVPWVVIAIYLISGAVSGTLAPAYLYGAFACVFLLSLAVAVNLYLQLRASGKWSSYLYAERNYLVLGLLSNSVLAWLVFVGTLQP